MSIERLVPSALWERIEQQRLAADEHQAECRATTCDRCGRYPCARCGVIVPGWEPHYLHPKSKPCCDACVAKIRLTKDLEPAMESLPPRFAWASFDNQALVTRCGLAAVQAARVATAKARVILVGPPGGGKTSLVVAMLRNAIEDSTVKPWVRGTCRFASAFDLNKSRGQHPLGQGEAPLVAAAIAANVLVLDDLGSEIDRFGTAVAEVLYERHNEERTTWVTTWMTPQEAASRYGGGIARRLFEDATIIRLGKVQAA